MSAASNVVRIKGAPEEWLREWLQGELKLFEGRVLGACVVLDVEDAEGNGHVREWVAWPETPPLIGHLQVLGVRLSLEVASGAGEGE